MGRSLVVGAKNIDTKAIETGISLTVIGREKSSRVCSKLNVVLNEAGEFGCSDIHVMATDRRPFGIINTVHERTLV